MAVADEFSGFSFAMGSLFGRRVWLIDAGGNLRGVTFKKPPWTPSVNEAACREISCDCPACLMYGSLVRRPEVAGEPGDGRHLAEHRCGFYAYFDGHDNDYRPSSSLPLAEGVVEGFGETVIGTKGFRAQKARIRALHIPPVQDFSLAFSFLTDSSVLNLGEGWPGYEARFQRCRAKYADITFYDDVDTMLREHPLSTPPDPE